MASNLVFADSFDHYDLQRPGFTPDYISKKWTQNIANGCNTTASGRNGRGLDLGINGGVGKTVNYTSKPLVGFAVNFNGNQGFASTTIYAFSSANKNVLGVLKIEPDGTLSLYAGNTANFIANSGTVGLTLKGQVFYYIEVACVITPGGGMGASMTNTMTLHVNGASIISGTAQCGINESATLNGIAQGNYHIFQNGAVNASTIIDDVYICDLNNGGVIATFLGDIAIGVVYPNGDSVASWTAVGGSGGNFGAVNPQFPETNVVGGIYIKDNNAGDVSEWQWQDIAPFTGQLKGVHYGLYSAKDGESTRSIQQTTQGTPNGPLIYPSDEGRYDFFGMDTDPSTGVAWTQAGFNASTFGVKLNS